MSNITKEQQTAISLFTCWWAMHEAQAEVIEEPFKPDQVALSFMGSGASTMVMVEHLRAVCDVLNSLAAPVASAAPSGFEQWARHEGLIQESHGVRSVNSMTDLARKAWQAALAHQPPKEALTDEKHLEAARKDGWDTGFRDQNKMMEDNIHYRERIFNRILELDKNEGVIRFTRIVSKSSNSQSEAATAPNKQLVEALQTIAAQSSGVPGSTARADCMAAIARAALAAAGVAPLPQAKEKA